jgi:hypothetical protein
LTSEEERAAAELDALLAWQDELEQRQTMEPSEDRNRLRLYSTVAMNALAPMDTWGGFPEYEPPDRTILDLAADRYAEGRAQCGLLRDIFGNPFRPVTFDTNWRTSDVTAMARGMYETRDFGAMPILADALQDAGCENTAVLDHCRGPGPHVRGCWVVDLILGKE